MSSRVRHLTLLCAAALVVLAMDVAGVIALASNLGVVPGAGRTTGVLHDGAVAARVVARVAAGLSSAVSERLARREPRMRFTPRHMAFAMDAISVPEKPCTRTCPRAAMRSVRMIELRCEEECTPTAPTAPAARGTAERAPVVPTRAERAPQAEMPMERAAHAVAIPMAL